MPPSPLGVCKPLVSRSWLLKLLRYASSTIKLWASSYSVTSIKRLTVYRHPNILPVLRNNPLNMDNNNYMYVFYQLIADGMFNHYLHHLHS